ncbi:hypothetical protein CYPRO_2195 [Cyclonatronum proteinivorum]|uniref:Uncharacterized protein n=1 Tax=Cyclonatronum proteinivorum TaxID=1457365 RepID=A0A345ULU1_9BACT|nr:hypothetical protein [Cyclonatronum proteinivorum]AXJ01443.1 hypothetical protein CYPRO_2195 [Cyclonatronum proteinivorum]
MKEDKFLTIFGTWIKASDVEDPDELVDPTGYWDYVTAPNVEGDGLDNEDEEGEGEDDWDADGDFDFLGF